MKCKLLIITLLLVLFSCENTRTENNFAQNSTQIVDDKLSKILDGEWAVINDWRDSVLTFNNLKDKNFKQEIFPAYNTIVFHSKNKSISVNTYGEFGCGMAALENLEINNSKWKYNDGQLQLSFDYSDYSGANSIDNLYEVDLKNETLKLKKMN